MKMIWKIVAYLYMTLIKRLPLFLICAITVSIIHSLSNGVITVIMARFFDSVTDIAGSAIKGGGVLSGIPLPLIGAALFLTAVSLGREAINGLDHFLTVALRTRLEGIFQDHLHRKCGEIDPISYEESDFLDSLEKAKKGVKGLIHFYFSISMILTSFLPYLIFMGIFLYRRDPVLALSLILIFVPVVVNQFLRIKVYRKLEDKAAPARRLTQHYTDCIGGREFFKETRLLGAYAYFRKLFDQSIHSLVDRERKVEIHVAKWEMMMKGITLSGHICILFLMINSLANGRITVGSFGAVFASLGTMMSAINQMVYFGFGAITRHLSSVENYIDFIEEPGQDNGRELGDWQGDISLNDIRFCYPNSETDAIKGISLEIKSGETLALVGINGSGKTTLVRLITGLYQPSEGELKWGSQATAEIRKESLYKSVSAVFQKFQRYQLSLGDNIGVSEPDSWNVSDRDEKPNEERITLAKSKSGIERDSNIMLSREFNGIDLSGGEWQRVAIARSYYKRHRLIVLDEPTAAIDPLEERAVFEKFTELAKDNTALIVTHRLGSVKTADRIVVMDKGKIVEIGSHSDLMNKSGLYARMFAEQAIWYKR